MLEMPHRPLFSPPSESKAGYGSAVIYTATAEGGQFYKLRQDGGATDVSESCYNVSAVRSS
jgi:hypothetical protein